jgi:hypothetical protein
MKPCVIENKQELLNLACAQIATYIPKMYPGGFDGTVIINSNDWASRTCKCGCNKTLEFMIDTRVIYLIPTKSMRKLYHVLVSYPSSTVFLNNWYVMRNQQLVSSASNMDVIVTGSSPDSPLCSVLTTEETLNNVIDLDWSGFSNIGGNHKK